MSSLLAYSDTWVNFKLQFRPRFFTFRPLYEDISQKQYISLRVVPTAITKERNIHAVIELGRTRASAR